MLCFTMVAANEHVSGPRSTERENECPSEASSAVESEQMRASKRFASTWTMNLAAFTL